MSSNDRAWSFNEAGDVFTLKTKEPPRDWTNVHFAEKGKRAYYSLFTNAGIGSVFVRDEEGNQPFLNNGQQRTIYFQNDETQKIWTIPDYPVFAGVQDYSAEYTNAATKLQSTFEGITCSQRVFVPMESLFEIWSVNVTNNTNAPQTISIFPYSSIDLGGFKILFRYGQTRMRWTHYHPEIQGLLTKNNSPFAPSDIYGAFLISANPVSAATGKPNTLLTPPYGFAHPNLHSWKDRFINGFDANCMCIKTSVTLAPGESKTVHFAFGCAYDVEAVKPVLQLIQNDAAVEQELQKVVEHFRRMNAQLQIHTGDERIDRYINQWAPKQIESYLTFKKAYRDNMQIDMVFGGLNYPEALDNLLDALSHQYEDGHAPHSFRPIVPIHYCDKPAWILMAVPEMIRESGDFSLLDVQLPYIDNDGKTTSYTESVLQHVQRAMRYLFNDIGIHQMSRMHYADWLDGLDGFSRVGDGESVLTTLMFAAGLLDVIGLAAAAGNEELKREASDMHREVCRRLNENAWDGEWYMRGFSGNGEKVGSKDNEFGQIFLNSQSWAILGGVPNEAQRESMLKAVDTILDTELGRRLYYPPYTRYFHQIGCISAQPPDYAMNAIYNHACTFSMVADCIAGRGDKAWEVLEKVVPDGANNPSSQSQNEPFSVTNSFKLAKDYYGECGEAWRTNTAAWAYRGATEYILGVRKDYKGLNINPCLPKKLKQASMTRVFRGATYHIDIENQSGAGQGVKSIEVDGKRIEGTILPLANEGQSVHVKVIV